MNDYIEDYMRILEGKINSNNIHEEELYKVIGDLADQVEVLEAKIAMECNKK